MAAPGFALLINEANAEPARCLLRYLVAGWYGKIELEVRDGRVIAVTPHGPRQEFRAIEAKT